MSSASTGGTEGSSPASSPASAASLAMAAPKFGTLVPNRIFVGGISSSTSEAELAQLFSTYGNVKATKIIADRAGVSKGYGFVTFETEEEAKRLQQESESIVLRERKLNIAPAIKKQLYNRSFDGGTGSPPAVPANPYYYPNGMGLAYQNGMTFYNPGAPAPATPVAPPTDPAALYQATSVFGPQATAGHQAFTPLMYPCPAPSLYHLPQQYQYPAMPYEQYYAGAAPTNAAPHLYPISSSQSSSTAGGNGAGVGNNNTGATSPPAGSLAPLASMPIPPPTHTIYATAAPHYHHPSIPTGPPPQQMDHLFLSFTAGPPPPHPSHTPLGLADQQLLLYTTDASCQQSQSDGQGAPPQEESHSVSSHSEQLHGDTPAGQVSGSVTPLVPLVPLKFPMSARYANYPMAIHATNLHGSQTCLSDVSTDETTANQMHCRTIVYHPATVYIPQPHAPQFHHQATTGRSLLPTPPPPARHIIQSNSKVQNNPVNRDYSKVVAVANAQNNYVKSQNVGIALISSGGFAKSQNINKYAGSELTQKFTSNVPASNRYPAHQHYNKRGTGSNFGSSYFHSTKSHYGNVNSYKSAANVVANGGGAPNTQRMNSGQHFEYGNNRRAPNHASGSVPGAGYKTSNYSVSQQSDPNLEKNATTKRPPRIPDNVVDKSTSPPPAPYSPMTRPIPTLSPPVPQVQFYAPPAQNRYQSLMHPPPTSGLQHQQQQSQPQQQQSAQRRYTVVPPLPAGRKPSEKYATTANTANPILRQPKYKPNGLMQPGGKVADENMGGAGDAPPGVGRMPITPPGTPRNHPVVPTGDQTQANDVCHQMQTLSL